MLDTLTNRENSIMMISGLERLTEQYKQAQKAQRRPPLVKRVWILLRIEGVLGIIRRVKHKLKLGQAAESPVPPRNPVPGNDLKLDSLDSLARKGLYCSKERIAVYTVLFGPYDSVCSPLIQPDNVDYYIITDQETSTGNWGPLAMDNLLPKEILGDPILCNRWCKMHPHLLFPEHSMSIYVDAIILITSDLTPMTAALEAFPISMFRHGRRDCVYDETKHCAKLKLISKRASKEQEFLLNQHGVPRHWGLLEAPVIARRHHDARCVSIMEEWWRIFYEEPAKRDQIALIDCLWKMSIPPEKIGVLGSDVLKCPMLLKFPHQNPWSS